MAESFFNRIKKEHAPETPKKKDKEGELSSEALPMEDKNSEAMSSEEVAGDISSTVSEEGALSKGTSSSPKVESKKAVKKEPAPIVDEAIDEEYKEEEIKTIEATDEEQVISEHLAVTGDITFSGKLEILGKVDGNVLGGKDIVVAGGVVTGDVSSSHGCVTVENGGVVEGDINAALAATIDDDGTVGGNIRSKGLSIGPKSKFNGTYSNTN
ncbi:MAG: polymer-forming cytoskeletal protein [Clostridiales Family XIII bacterium]|jgi:cytoskeletal protein CcmA (bactofilin family)|nr:polymer-forming cytoskeletal protein [Clostridiales Family XIII bacterium]